MSFTVPATTRATVQAALASTLRDFQYKLGLNTDIHPFDKSYDCVKGGLYYTDIDAVRAALEASMPAPVRITTCALGLVDIHADVIDAINVYSNYLSFFDDDVVNVDDVIITIENAKEVPADDASIAAPLCPSKKLGSGVRGGVA